MPSIYDELRRCLRNEQLVALATVTSGPGLGKKLLVWPDGGTLGDLGSPQLNDQVAQEARRSLAAQTTGSLTLDPSSGEEPPIEVFLESYPPPEKLIIVGAVHVAIPLISLAKTLGLRTVVVDPRTVFATPERFAHADHLLVKWPAEALDEVGIHESTYVVCLTHDEKLDNPALQRALASPARYIGALGSKKTHAKRVVSLKEMGLTDEDLARIHAPIGLRLGGRRPEEIAVAILAQMVAARYGLA